jgi:hypothetical protein
MQGTNLSDQIRNVVMLLRGLSFRNVLFSLLSKLAEAARFQRHIQEVTGMSETPIAILLVYPQRNEKLSL